jgi:ferredoxin
VKVGVDLGLCQGHGVCAGEAPEVFAVDPAESRVVLLEANPPETLRAKVEAAVKYCPTRALRITEE